MGRRIERIPSRQATPKTAPHVTNYYNKKSVGRLGEAVEKVSQQRLK